jgi:hypothetical protein
MMMAMCFGTVRPAGLDFGRPLVIVGESCTAGFYKRMVWSRPGPTLAIVSFAPVRSAIPFK